MSYTEVDICNLGLGLMGANLIMSLDDSTDEARLCKVTYPFARDAVLEARDWTFACARQMLAPEQQEPTFGYSYKFLLPAKCIRVRRVSDGPDFDAFFHWEKEGRSILCDVGTIYIKYVERVTDPTYFSPTFAQAVAARLGMELCLPLSASADTYKALAQAYGIKLEESGNLDGLQGVSEKLRSTTLTKIR